MHALGTASDTILLSHRWKLPSSLLKMRMDFRRVKTVEEAPEGAILLSLFRCEVGLVRGWFIGPVLSGKTSEPIIPYEAKSQNLLGALAIIRARDIAIRNRLKVYIIDPDDLWDEAWGSH